MDKRHHSSLVRRRSRSQQDVVRVRDHAASADDANNADHAACADDANNADAAASADDANNTDHAASADDANNADTAEVQRRCFICYRERPVYLKERSEYVCCTCWRSRLPRVPLGQHLREWAAMKDEGLLHDGYGKRIFPFEPEPEAEPRHKNRPCMLHRILLSGHSPVMLSRRCMFGGSYHGSFVVV